jgi:sialic acid synthase SpsE
MANEIQIGSVKIGDGHPPKVIAEIGINHGGSLSVAKEMVSSAISQGAHLIKHQTHIPIKEMSREAESAIPGNTHKSIYQVMEECALSAEDEFELAEFTKSKGGVFFSTPFSREAVDRLMEIGVPGFKIGSGECSNYPLVDYVASKGLPIILSTGMNSIETIGPSVEIFRARKIDFALMHTTNLYPTPQKLLRLGALNQLQSAFPDAVLGLSDHSVSNSACYAAVSMGASVLERHFTDSKTRQGPDIVCSMDPSELEELLRVSEEIFQALGGNKEPAKEEGVTMNFAFASVASQVDIEQGEQFTWENIFPVRPAGGVFGPLDYESLIGRVAANPIPARRQLRIEDVKPE